MPEPLLLNAITQVRNPTTPESQIAALKYLKNESVGHTERKEELVRYGIINALGQVLEGAAKLHGKRRDNETSTTSERQSKIVQWKEEDEIRIQAILLLNSIAHGGPAFVAPIVAGLIIPSLIAALSPSENHPKIVVASLRTLLYLAESSHNVGPRSESLLMSPSIDVLYARGTIRNLAEILSQRSQSNAVQTQISYTCQFLSATCVEEYQRIALTTGGLLDLLGARLAAYHAHQRFFPVRLHPSLYAALPPPPSSQLLPHLLSAITCIVRNAKYRIARLLCSPCILDVFPFHRPESNTDPSFGAVSSNGGLYISPLEFALPQLQWNHQRPESDRAFPALGTSQAPTKNGLVDLVENGSSTIESGAEPMIGSSGSESSLVSWLFQTMRSHHGLCRIYAIDLLVSINVLGFLSRNRDRLLAVLVMPLLLSMIEEKPAVYDTTFGHPSSEKEARIVKEQAPIILGQLLKKNPDLQKAVIDAGGLTRASQSLKQSFEALESQPPSWLPKDSLPHNTEEVPVCCQLGPSGLRVDLIHLLNTRTGALRLLAGIVTKDDKHRKILTDSGAVAYIIDSLVPFREEALSELESGYANGNFKVQPALLGNSDDVLLAACDVALALSRSVELLRTSLIDARLSRPVFVLLKHPNPAVVRAATDIVCNLVLEFSPMREDLVQAGIISTLCEHAHSADSALRLTSLWALKHLMTEFPVQLKLTCLEELGAGWLIQVITGGFSAVRSSKDSQTLAMGAANAAGERIDILNAVDEPMDTAEDGAIQDSFSSNYHTGDSTLVSDTTLHFLLPPNDAEFSVLAVQYRVRLNALKAAEDRDALSQAYADELKTQTQGFDFLRNITSSPGAADMIDTVFQNLGASVVFDLVSSKLKWPPTQTVPNVNGNGSPGNGSNVSANPELSSPADLEAANSLLEAAVQVLVHIGAGAPRHRQQLISQTALLKALLPFFGHQDDRVRTAAVWVIINLTWVDDASDALGVRQRALELRKLGYEEVLKGLAAGDPSKDVMERARTGVEQMRTAIEDGMPGARHR